MQRNAAVAMGNRGDAAYVEPLGAALAEGSPVVQRHAAWALGRIGGPVARSLLESALADSPDPAFEDELRRALAAL